LGIREYSRVGVGVVGDRDGVQRVVVVVVVFALLIDDDVERG
jgi:hypothetical protein